MKKMLAGLAVLFFIIVPGHHNTMAADGAEPVPSYDAEVKDPKGIGQPAYVSKREDLSELLIRIEELEHQVKYMKKEIRIMDKQLGASRTLANMINEGKSLASDAWDIAVEARAIAVRAEQKAEQAKKDAK
jgi:hypothetical protein